MSFEAEDLIRQAIKRHSPHIAVSCSFGKDSITILHMALKYDPNIKVIFENSYVDFPETLKYKNMMKDEWKLNLYETKPLKTYWQCKDEYGLPKCRKRGGKGSNAPKCCYYLKEKPALILERELKVNTIITGLQACESQSRTLLAMRYDNKKAPYMSKDNIEFCSQRWFTRKTGIWNYHPIMKWSIRDVWQRTLNKNIEINPVYWKWDINGQVHDKLPNLEIGKDRLILNGIPALYPRCGCLPCTAYSSWKERLSISHPILYKRLEQDARKN